MDFDEYDYLEKTVENPEPEKSKDKINGNGETVKSKGKEERRGSKHKSDENGNDMDNRSKRTKSRDERGDRERERGDLGRERDDRGREKGSSRRQSSPRDVERSERSRHKSSHEHKDRERDTEREERNGMDRDREKRKEKDKVREQEKRLRDRENDKEKDGESGREQSHWSRTRSERQKEEPDREKHKDKERSRDVEFKEREKEKEPREPERESRNAVDSHRRRNKEKREEEQDVDPERDQRTVFAYQICLKADERDVYEFFSRAGKVRDVRLIMDRKSRRSRGVGYIEFYDAMSVPMAIALSGQTLLSSQVMVKPSEAEKNLVQSTASASGLSGGLTGPYSGGARKLYVGNLHYNIREDQLRQVFEAFGSVELVQLPLDQETGHCKGYGFVQFARLEDARAAESLNGQLEIAGRAIKVSALTDQAGMQNIGVNPGDLDDDEGGGLSLNAHSRAILMQKLDRSGTTSSVTGILGIPAFNSLGLSQPTAPGFGTGSTVSPQVNPLVQAPGPPFAGFPAVGLSVPCAPVPSVDIVGAPSECLLLKNMFDPDIESEPDFDLDIKEDVQEECSKYGTLKHIFVDKNTQGFVYLRFDNTQAALGAQRALHGRWFAQKMITASFMVPQAYESKFPDSK